MKSALKYGCLTLLALGLIGVAGLFFLAWNAKPLPTALEALAGLPVEEREAVESLCKAAGIKTSSLRHIGGHLEYLYEDERNNKSFYVNEGHVLGISLRNVKFATLPDFRHLTALEVIDLSHSELLGWPDFASLPALERLVLSGNRVADPEPALLPPNVVTLRLSHTLISSTTPFAGLKHLKNLDLSGTQVVDFRPLTGLALDELNLANSKVTSLPPAVPGKGDWEVNLDGTVVVMPPGYSRDLPKELYNGKEFGGKGLVPKEKVDVVGVVPDITGPSRIEMRGGTDPSAPPVTLEVIVTGGRAQVWMVEPPGLFVSPWFERRLIKGFGLLRQPGWVFTTVDAAHPGHVRGKLRLDTVDRTYEAPSAVRSQPGWSRPPDWCDYSFYVLPLDGKPVAGMAYRITGTP